MDIGIETCEDEDWWLRHNDRSRLRPDAGFSFYPRAPALAPALRRPREDRRALVQEMARRMAEPGYRKAMAQRYQQVMSRSAPQLRTESA